LKLLSDLNAFLIDIDSLQYFNANKYDLSSDEIVFNRDFFTRKKELTSDDEEDSLLQLTFGIFNAPIIRIKTQVIKRIK
jgi:hypothetical protein